jgi:hypothetical protein
MISVNEIKDLKHELTKVLGTQDEIVDIISTEIEDQIVVDLGRRLIMKPFLLFSQ